jgi:hypothetical protein
MRHFFGYKDDGTLFIQIVHTGGHANDCNIDDPDCTHELAQTIRVSAQAAADNNGVTLQGIVEYICPCPSSMAICNCVPAKRANAYYCPINACLVDKPDTQVVVDGVTMTNLAELIRPPGSLFTVKVLGETINDGETVELRQAYLHPTTTHTLTFTNGVSAELTLTVPAQGLTGFFNVWGKYVSPIIVYVKAFA